MKQNLSARQFLLSNFTKKNTYFDTEIKLLNEYFPLHYHNYFEIELIIKGRGIEYINQHKVEIKPGLMYLLSPTDIHEYDIREDVLIHTIAFDYPLVPPSLLPNLYNNSAENFIIHLSEDQFKLNKCIFDTIKQEYDKNDDFSSANIQYLLNVILSQFIRGLPQKITSESNNDKILLAISHLLIHFNENPSVEEVAKLVGYNTSYFSTIFKKYTKKSYTDYLLNLKLSHAKKLLKINKMSILEVSLSSGFESISNFNRYFKKIVGISPTQYKKTHL